MSAASVLRFARSRTHLAALARVALLALVCAFTFTLAGAARAQDGHPVVLDATQTSLPLSVHVRALADPEQRLRIDEVRLPPLHDAFSVPDARGGDLNFGYAGGAYWLRVDLLLPDSGTRFAAPEWLLEVAFPTLDRVEVFVGAADEPLVAGDHQPFAQRPYDHRNLVFPLDLQAGQTTTVWMRVASQGTLTMPLTVWRADAFAHYSQRTYAALALHYGAVLALLLYNLLLFLAIRDRSYLEYVLSGLGMLLGQLSLNGFGNQFIWPASPQWGHIALPLGFALCTLFAAMFTRSFLDTRTVAPTLDKLLILFALIAGATGASLFALPYHYGAIATSLLGPAFAGLAILCGLYCYRRRKIGAGTYLLAWTLVLIGTAIMGARNFAWLPTNALTLYALQIASVLGLLLLSFALASRIHAMRRARAEAQTQALAANEQLVQGLRQSEQDLAQRVADRTNELAQVNQRLLEKEQHLQHLAHHDPLTGLANRLLLDERIRHALQRARRHNLRTAVLLIDLDGFKPINDEHGHAVGDELLVAVTKRICAVVRAEDTVGRLGSDEFVVLLEDAFDPDDVRRVEHAIGESLSGPFKLSDISVSLGASVGHALFPEDGTTPEALLKAADKKMYGVKKSKEDSDWRSANGLLVPGPGKGA